MFYSLVGEQRDLPILRPGKSLVGNIPFRILSASLRSHQHDPELCNLLFQYCPAHIGRDTDREFGPIGFIGSK